MWNAGTVLLALAMIGVPELVDRYVAMYFVGPPSGGHEDGQGSAARFRNMDWVAVDRAGNVYVADTGNHTIRKIRPDGTVTTLAGKAGEQGSADGDGSAARFYYPHGIATDSADNVYVADSWNQTIRKITPSGSVSTLAGKAGTLGSSDGSGPDARFFFPFAMAVDRVGNILVADQKNSTIRKVTAGGIVTTVAGLAGVSGSIDGAGAAARFNEPRDVATDDAGNIYVADTYNHTIRKITSDGVVTTLAGAAGTPGSSDGVLNAVRFDNPHGVAADREGNIYVSDTNNHTIRRISRGLVTTIAGAPGKIGSADGRGTSARFYHPIGLAINGSGNIFVADYDNHAIRKITPLGIVTTIAGRPPGARAVRALARAQTIFAALSAALGIASLVVTIYLLTRSTK